MKILLALASPSLVRVAQHLLHEIPAVELRVCPSGLAVVGEAARLLPDVLVVSARFLGRERFDGVAALRGVAPAAKLVVITSDEEPWLEHDGRLQGIDASLEEEDLVRALLPIVHILSGQELPTPVV
jgi:hypothetical protein